MFARERQSLICKPGDTLDDLDDLDEEFDFIVILKRGEIHGNSMDHMEVMAKSTTNFHVFSSKPWFNT